MQLRSLAQRASGLAALLLGALALAAATLVGWEGVLGGLIISPPVPVRALLAAAAGLLGIWLVLRAAARMRSSSARELIRGVRLAFLAVAAFAAASGWALGSALPIVAALIIAGVDVIETSFLLLVAVVHSDRR
jgi:hypothetical protein